MTVKIPLSKGGFVLIDNIDFDYVSKFVWFKNNTGYVMRWFSDHSNVPRQVSLHRDILRPERNQMVDHINRDKLDNRRSNLRSCSNSQNLQNRTLQRNNRVGFKGVYRNSRDNRYYARITANGITHFLGSFISKEEAALAYNQGAIKYHGEFARINKL